MPSVKALPDVGRRLNAARLRRGLSQGTVARRAGIAASYLSRVENGKIQPTFRMVLRIAEAMRADFSEIVGPTKPGNKRAGICPVTDHGRCLLDSIRAETAPDGADEGDSYTPRQVRLLRRLALWMHRADASRLRAMEILLEDLMEGVQSRSAD